jgi:hypothetical protein
VFLLSLSPSNDAKESLRSAINPQQGNGPASGERHKDLIRARIAKFYLAWGKPEQAAKWRVGTVKKP